MVPRFTHVLQASKDPSSSKEYKRSHTTPLPDTSPIDGSSSSSAGGLLAAQVSSSTGSQHSKAAAGLRQGIAAAIAKLSIHPFDSSSSSNDPKVQALEYKHQHGYLPSPSASSPGNRQSLRQATSIKSSLSRACSSKLSLDNSTGGLCAAEGDDDDDDDESEAAAEDDSSLLQLPALPPGAVPVFGSSSTAAASATPAAAAAGVSLSSNPASSSSSIKAAPSSKPMQPQQRQQPAATVSIAAAQIPKSLSLAPANVVEPTLLAVSPRLAPAMQRSCWCMADFVIQKKLYEGYASTICKVRKSCQASG
jgi:hypothetical protein